MEIATYSLALKPIVELAACVAWVSDWKETSVTSVRKRFLNKLNWSNMKLKFQSLSVFMKDIVEERFK